MMKKGLFTILSLLCLSFMAGCSSTKPIDIEMTGGEPTVYLNEECDFSKYIKMQDGVSYSLDVKYYDYLELKTHAIECNGLKFTQKNKFDVIVNILAKQGNNSGNRVVNVRTQVKGDAIDELLVSDGYSGFCDAGYRKELNTTPQYMKGENSNSSINCIYQGGNAYPYGGQILAIENFRCLDCWTDKTWENAILTFWVYNMTDADLTFGLRIKDESGLTDVDIDYGQQGNIYQTVGSEKWTQVFFSLRKLGINHTLYKNEEGTRTDAITVKVTWADTPKEIPTPLYSYQFYVDGIDIVPHTMYPEIDTRVPDKMDNLLITRAWTDDAVKKEANYNKDFIKEGESSVSYAYEGNNTYAGLGGPQILTFAHEQALRDAFTDKTWKNAVLKFWCYNPTDQEIEFKFVIYDNTVNPAISIDWDSPENISRKAAGKAWTLIQMPLADVGVNHPLINDGSRKEEFNVKMRWAGTPSKTEKYSYQCYIDALDLVEAE